MTTDTPNKDIDAKAAATAEPGIHRPANRDWLKSRAKSYSLRLAVVSAVLWVSVWNKSGNFISGTPLILFAFVSSCAAIGFYVAHRRLNK
jgi:hypothetical protein